MYFNNRPRQASQPRAAALLSGALLLSLTGCGGSGSSGTTGAAPQTGAATSQTVAKTTGTGAAPITLSASASNAATISIPANALTPPAGAPQDSATITVAQETGAVATPKNVSVLSGTAYDFGPSGTQFNPPATVQISYDPSKIPSGATESGLQVYTVDGGGAPTLVTGGAVDTTKHVLTFPAAHFSAYYLAPSHAGIYSGAVSGATTLNEKPAGTAVSASFRAMVDAQDAMTATGSYSDSNGTAPTTLSGTGSVSFDGTFSATLTGRVPAASQSHAGDPLVMTLKGKLITDGSGLVSVFQDPASTAAAASVSSQNYWEVDDTLTTPIAIATGITTGSKQ